MACWLVTGASGQLGSHIVAELCKRPENVVVALYSGLGSLNIPEIATTLQFACPIHYESIDFTPEATEWTARIKDIIAKYHVTRVIHCAAITNVQKAFKNPEVAHSVNVEATRALAEVCATTQNDVQLMIHCSTDMVFNGSRAPRDYHGQSGAFYEESDETCPLSVYGKTKADAEQAIIKIAERTDTRVCRFVIARCPLMFGLIHLPRAAQSANTFAVQLRQLVNPELPCNGFSDEFRTPLSFRAAAKTLLSIARNHISLEDGYTIMHIAGRERISRYDFLVRMRAAVSEALLSNDLSLMTNRSDQDIYPAILTALGRQDLLDNQGDDDIASPVVAEPLSPSSQVRAIGAAVMDRKIVSCGRDSCGAFEPRPGDLSLSIDKLTSWCEEFQVEIELPTLEEDLQNALELWIQLL